MLIICGVKWKLYIYLIFYKLNIHTYYNNNYIENKQNYIKYIHKYTVGINNIVGVIMSYVQF